VPTLQSGQLEKIDRWLRSVLWDHELRGDKTPPFEIHRSKGRLVFENGATKMLQGVREVFELIDSPQGTTAQPGVEGKIILIGRGLRDIDFDGDFRRAIL
jgi:hypothetical protein